MSKETREFQVRLLKWTQIHELPDGWPNDRLLSLLAILDVDGVAESDALEMTLMALQDLDPDEASDRVLEAIFGESMRRGIRHELVQDLKDGQPWENFVDLAQQAKIFNAAVLLQRAFPRQFDKPDAVSVVLRLDTASERGRAWLDAPAPDPALLLRILAAGMDEHAVLRRLFHEALGGSSFPEAGAILWQIDRRAVEESSCEFMLISNNEWFEPLRDLDDWTATAWPDATGARPLDPGMDRTTG